MCGCAWHGPLPASPVCGRSVLAPALAADTASWVRTQLRQVIATFTGVSNHVWEGITFQYGTWGQVNKPDGFVDSQSAVFSCTPGTPGCNAALQVTVCATMLRCCNAAVLKCCGAAMLRCCNASVLQCCGAAMLRCCNAAVMQCCNSMVMQFSGAAMLKC